MGQSSKGSLRIMSRYPSAYGHTPGYRSMTASTPNYPSALDRGMDLSSGLGGRTSSSLMDSSLSSLASDPLMRHSTALSPSGSSRSAESSYQSKSYSSSTVQSSSDGGRPHHSSLSDSTYKSTRTGASGIPHTSYSHTSSSFDSDRPYRNNVSSFSYNI